MSTPTELNDLDVDGFDLAQRLWRTLPQDQLAAIVVNACCWMLADLVLRAEVAGIQEAEATLVPIVKKLRLCIEQLRGLARRPPGIH
jgi:hypothetical protein